MPRKKAAAPTPAPTPKKEPKKELKAATPKATNVAPVFSSGEQLSVAEIRAQVSKASAAINKQLSMISIVDVDDAPSPYSLRRPSGITQLDIDTGGGLPAGGLTYISGPDSAGKTWLLYNYFRMNQLIYKERSSILFIPAEFLPDYKLMRQIGCQVPIPNKELDLWDQGRLQRGLPVLTEEERASYRTSVGQFKIGRAPTAEKVMDLITEAYASRAFQIIALDSVSILQSEAEAELDTLSDNPQQAANARCITRFHQRWHPLAIGGDIFTSLIFTAQVRSNRKKTEAPSYIQKYLNEWTNATGANAGRHGKMIDIQLKSGASDKEKDGKERVAVGKEIKWEITKGKSGTHDGIVGCYDYRYAAPGDHTQDLINVGIRYGIIRETDGLLTVYHTLYKSPLVVRPQNQDILPLEGIHHKDFHALLAQNPDVEIAVRKEVYAAGGATNICF